MSSFKKNILLALVSFNAIVATTTMAEPARSLDQAKYATETRQAVFKLLGSNMGPLGAMAKGKIPVDAKRVEKNAVRINQLSLMIADYTRIDTTKFDVKTEALDIIWADMEHFIRDVDKLTLASTGLITAAQTKDAALIKKAIGAVGKTCGGCHDDFKAE